MSTWGNATPSPHLCQQLGFDERFRGERLALMNLSEADIPFLQHVNRAVIQPQALTILDRFYEYLLGFHQLRAYLGNEEHIQRLKTTQMEYLLGFGLDFLDVSYFEYRLRIGIAHERIGLPLHMYLAAYRHLQTLIQTALPFTAEEGIERYHRYLDNINKIVMLDVSLAIDAYTRVRSDLVNASLQAIAQERDILTSQLMHDTLTQTLSRRFILETLGKQLAELYRQPEHQLGIALMDLDHFKQINDTYGHLVGDKILYEFSHVVSKRVREQDYFGRFGGEEFLLILTGIPAKESLVALNRIREAVELHSFKHEGKPVPLTVSMGFTMAQAGEKVDDLIDRADHALYQAKSAGRNQIIHT